MSEYEEKRSAVKELQSEVSVLMVDMMRLTCVVYEREQCLECAKIQLKEPIQMALGGPSQTSWRDRRQGDH